MARNKVFISYRRVDSAAMCDRIYARLVEVFGRDTIFKDIDAIPLGVNFETYIQQAMAESTIALVLIGRSWLTVQAVNGGRRLDDPTDNVRLEVEEALKSTIPVIPLMVDGADLPSSDQLPESLRPLVKQNGRKINVDPYFDIDMQRLTKEIETWVPSLATRQQQAEAARLAAQQAEAARLAAQRAEATRLATQRAEAARLAIQRAQPVTAPPSILSRPRVRPLGVVAALSGLLVVGLLVALANGAIKLPQLGGGGVTGGISNGRNCKHVAFLLPESATAARWEAADHPDVVAAIRANLPNATVDVLNAQGDATTQQTQAESELTRGACILVVAAVDSTAAAAIVTKAKASNMPVIAYDRLIQSDDLAYYVSIDNVDVGKKQGQYIADHYKDYVTTGHNNGLIPNLSEPACFDAQKGLGTSEQKWASSWTMCD